MREIYENTQVAFDTKTAFIKQPMENKVAIKSNLLPVLRWAAVIVVAACIGAAAGRWSRPEVPQQKQQQVIASSDTDIKSQGIRLKDIGDGFWRKKLWQC